MNCVTFRRYYLWLLVLLLSSSKNVFFFEKGMAGVIMVVECRWLSACLTKKGGINFDENRIVHAVPALSLFGDADGEGHIVVVGTDGF